MKIIIILIMLICEMLFSVLPNVIRYNRYGAERWMLLVMLSYSMIWLHFLMEDDGSQWIMSCIYLAGVIQGIAGTIENATNRKRYQEKKEYIRTFEKNTFIVLSFDTIEKYTVHELRLLKILNEQNKGQKSKNILLIQKDMKKDRVMLMFFIRKMTDTIGIREYCEKNYDIVEIGENNGKQVVICYLK
ncbi:MAG: hypothetical protein K2L07_02520 [Lachnospiraceae bacterium]|nr:hypothetical protein [Lachnospiraceae bacterium]